MALTYLKLGFFWCFDVYHRWISWCMCSKNRGLQIRSYKFISLCRSGSAMLDIMARWAGSQTIKL